MSAELLACPFCGCKNSEVMWVDYRYRAVCDRCGAMGQGELEQVDAGAAWNRRAQQPPFVNIGDSEDRYVADGRDLNCPACGGSGHVDDAQEPVGVIVGEFRNIDGYTPCIRWSSGEHPGVGTKLYAAPTLRAVSDEDVLHACVAHDDIETDGEEPRPVAFKPGIRAALESFLARLMGEGK